ncbi:gamma-glutamylcyclotransferase [Neobacillus mesonae]|uniref:gamma-glutamylcyclotransferase n=1 Tax=Neobacillus mesonae TaxID=1193713 RepID=UPI00203A9FAD|nr:gamma-glutamylcyclotransferase [Neobacillus mesonae]MCM3569313.1 gamma-glutamylcyclotransferase [Neobacillus mesonae]
MRKVFVYGTLRKGEGNAHLKKNASCIAEQCWTNGKLYDAGYGYPAMKQSQSSYVYGELYSVTETELNRLDVLEGYRRGGSSNLYERVEQTVYTDKGQSNAYVYVAGPEMLLNKRIPWGDWKEYKWTKKQNDSILYFAYGSCMDNKRFIEKRVDAYFQDMLGVGVLDNYTLRFTRKSKEDGMGRADIVEEGGRVEGKVYKIPIEALKNYLYQREGAPTAYRATFVTIKLHGKDIQALTFTVKDKEEETAPSAKYEEEILRGADGYLSADYISKLKTHINFLKNLHQTIGGM